MDDQANEEVFSIFSGTASESLGDMATIDNAKLHEKASGVYRLRGSNIMKMKIEDRCPCCFFPCNSQKFSMTDLDNIGELGLGFPFLFYLTAVLGIMLLVDILIAAIPNLIQNLVSGRQGEHGQSSPLAQASVGGNGNDDSDLKAWPVILHLISLIFMCVLHTLATLYLRRKVLKLNEDFAAPSDFTVIVKNLGTEWKDEELKEHFEKHSRLQVDKASDTKVESLDVSSDISEYISIMKKIKQLCTWRNIDLERRVREERCLRCFQCCTSRSTHYAETMPLAAFNKQLDGLKSSIDEIETRKKSRTGVAFVAFETEEKTMNVINRWKATIFQQFLFGVCFFGSHRFFRNRLMIVKRAPDPTDIIWENLIYSHTNRVIRQCCTLLVLASILTGSYFILQSLADLQKDLSDQRNRSENTKGIDYTSIPAAVIILVVNILLDLVIRWLAYLERSHTYTERTLSTARKLTYVLSLNTLLFPLLAHQDSKDWYTPGGLANSIFWVAISSAFAKTLIKLVHPLWIWRAFRKWQITKAIKGDTLFVSQAKANFYYQKEEIDIADCYSDLMVRFLFTLAYVPLMPLVAPIMLLGYIADYWVNKYVLLRNSCRPKLLGEKIAFKMLFFVKPAIILYGIAIYGFFYDINASTKPLGIAAIVISGTYCLLHSLVFSCFFRAKKEKKKNGLHYQEAKKRFFPVRPTQTYEMVNPITRNRAKASLHLPQLNSASEFAFDRPGSFPRAAAVPHFNNMGAFNTQHYGLAGVWNLVLHEGFLDPFAQTGGSDQSEGQEARGGRVSALSP